ncbi:hypothetical protein RND81_11G223700 [Saponaria officinalis]
MDSVNSGSIHSSSTCGGDDQEFDSRATVGGGSMAAFFNPSSLPSFHNTVPFHHTFDLPTFSQSFPNNNNNNHNFNNNNNNDYNNNNNNNNNNNINDLGMVWPEKYNSIIKQSNVSNYSLVDDPKNCTSTGFNPTQNPLPTERVSTESTPGSSDHPGPGGGGRNPKKRSRASRRAPTTVLTTDTNNFRQMVQEFTGIPAPPFSGRARLDLFGGLGIPFPRTSSTHLPGSLLLDVSNSEMQQQQQPPFILRPFPQKINQNHPNHTIQCQLGQPEHGTRSHGPNATTGSQLNEFALGHVTTTTTTTITTTGATTTVHSGNMIMSALNNDRLPLQRQVNATDDDVGVNFNNGSNKRGGNGGNCLENSHHASVGRSGSEGMMDSWICSSSDN